MRGVIAVSGIVDISILEFTAKQNNKFSHYKNFNATNSAN
jgi:hypothetical protein